MTRFALLAFSLASVAGCLAEVPGDTVDGPEIVDEDTSTPDDAPASDSGDEDIGQLTAVVPKKQIAYVVIPHPDDEWEAWSLIEKSPANYPVFILLTQGEETGGCHPKEIAGVGPHWYQGPNSPVGQPNLGEYVLGNPWQGRWTASCSAARIASYHLFLDRMAKVDPALPYKPPYIGRFCFGGTTSDGAAPSRIDNDNTVVRPANCAKVYADSKGARVIFDLGDRDLRPAEVIWAVQAVRANRAALKIPALREYEVLGASFYNATGPDSGAAAYPSCNYYGHPDHHAIHAALWNTNVGAGPQLVRACDTDPDVAKTNGRVDYVDASTDRAAFEVNQTTKQRIGAHVAAYGWLQGAYYDSCPSGCIFARKQSFWRR